MAYDYRYSKQWRLDRSRGITRLVDAADARIHIATLTGAGWSLRAIAGTSGVSNSSIAKVAKGEQRKLHRYSAARILAIDPDQVPSQPSTGVTEPFVPRIGTVRRVQALLYMGWGHKQMTERCGHRTALLLHQQGRWVTRTTHDDVAEMYRDLSHLPGPSSKARTYADRHGYRGPLAWDDIDLDLDPEPDPADASAATATADDRLDEIDHLLSFGESLAEALRRVGWGRDAYDKAIARRRDDVA